jgi:hypothetical protein
MTILTTDLIELRQEIRGVLGGPSLAPRVLPPAPAGFGLNGKTPCQACGAPRRPGQQCPGCVGPRRPRRERNRYPGPNVRGAKMAAAKLGIPVEEWRRHIAAGERHCGYHRRWHPKAAFDRGDQGCCRAGKSQRRHPGATPLLGPDDRWCVTHSAWHGPEAFSARALAEVHDAARCIAWEESKEASRAVV